MTINLEQLQHSHFGTGKNRDFSHRQDMLNTLRNLLMDNSDDFLQALQKDLPRPSLEAWISEIMFTRKEIDHALGNLAQWMAPQKLPRRISQPLDRAEVRREPMGRVLVIGPWNYPLQLLLSPAVGAFAAGNCITLKPSEHSPNTAELLKKLVERYFNPEDLAVVCGGVEISKELLKQKFDHIFFTGGTETGRRVMLAAAETLTPVTLELGGKSPCIVDLNAPLEKTVQRILWGKFFNAGQTCVAPDYLLVPSGSAGEFIETARHTIRSFYGIDPSTSPDYPRIINRNHFDRIISLITDEIVIGGEYDAGSLYIAPTLIFNPSPSSKIMSEEIFGPLLPVMEYRDIGEAIDIVRKNPDPLALYLFSADEDTQEKVLSSLRYGGACINDTVLHLANPDLPFGGIGKSGMGRYHGHAGFLEMSRATGVLWRSPTVELPLRYPPYGEKLNAVKSLL